MQLDIFVYLKLYLLKHDIDDTLEIKCDLSITTKMTEKEKTELLNRLNTNFDFFKLLDNIFLLNNVTPLYSSIKLEIYFFCLR